MMLDNRVDLPAPVMPKLFACITRISSDQSQGLPSMS